MKLRRIHIEGFRGALKPIQVKFGEAFTIVSGRNGTGKSTICDALEYVLTGTLERFQTETEKGERIEDYLWWRGLGSPNERIVSLTFVDDSGNEHTLSRGPDSQDSFSAAELLYDVSNAPEFALSRLCQTSILRDETITRFSTDMSETDRFEFVNRAIGLSRFRTLEERLTSLNRKLRDVSADRRAEYERCREESGRISSELSQARVTVSDSVDVDLQKTLQSLAAELGQNSLEITSINRSGREVLARLRSEIDDIERAASALRELDPTSPSRINLSHQLELLKAQLNVLNTKLKNSDEQLERASKALERERQKTPQGAWLAQLRESGSRAGLQDGKCPLCGSEVTAQQFDSHIAEVAHRLAQFNSDLEMFAKEYAEGKALNDRLRGERADAERAYKEMVSRVLSMDKEFERLQERATQLGAKQTEGFPAATQQRRERIQSIESRLSILQSSMALDRVADLERQVDIAKKRVSSADIELSKASAAEALSREIDAALKRVAAEIVDERLADLSPLLSELYLRLRPHSEWSEIQYLMRGDIRRFLSFSVGPDINPRFVFSSGQRRALGLSFLLAVHLSRKWCRLETLVLDDPVQHIDDFRAMHLVEVLSSIRRAGRQIVCAIEDPALADLLCRRLEMRASGEGVRVEMHFESGRGVSSSQSSIAPLVSQALLSA